MYKELILDATVQNQVLHRWLKKTFPNVPFNELQKWLRTGQIRYNGKRAKGKEILEPGAKLRLPPFMDHFTSPSAITSFKGNLGYVPSEKEMEQFKNNILFENDAFLVLNKPAGLSVQGGSNIRNHVDGLARALYPDYPPKLVHRLDKETSGLLILAKTHIMAQKLTKAFQENMMQKEYVAVVEGIPQQDQGEIITQLIKESFHVKVASASVDSKLSETFYTVRSKNISANKACLSLIPYTGRTHQLRVHCQHMGFPILGDTKYNPSTSSPHLHLHAIKIIFPDSLGGYLFTAELPDYFSKTLLNYQLK